MKKEEEEEYNNFLKGWEDYRNLITENKNKSQDDFEKYINLLASGGIVLSITFIEKIITIDKTICSIFYILGLLCLVITLLSNLYSHFKSMQDSDATIKEIDEKKYDEIFKNIEKRNKPINRLNAISIWSLIIGVLLILTFVSINLFTMSDKPKSNPTPNPKPRPSTEEHNRGRVTPTPKPNLKPDNPKK